MTKKKQADADEAEKAGQSLEQLVLDKREGKYRVVELVSYWAKSLRQKEEHRHLTQNELLEEALEQVLSGKVAEKDVEKAKETSPINDAPPEGALEKAKKRLTL
ncbi:MAG: hypothetical protein KGL53_07840 [Elusimicrobia bacterium]|nr:hypothetical protein [Elusimicrobiota bacterium]